MRVIMAIILTIVLAVASAAAGIRHYCDTNPGLTIQGTPDYSTSYSYDLNGNPTQIYRKGIVGKYSIGNTQQWNFDEMDILYPYYRGNQMQYIEDTCLTMPYEGSGDFQDANADTNDYTWDANGNMTKDLNRGITSIQYNLQNQPTRIVYNDRHYEGRIYNSAGQKLRTVHTVLVTSATSSSTSTTTLVIENKRDYYGEDLVYRNDTLEMVLTDVGYVDASGNYHYYMLDYQGNVRQVVDVQGNVIEQNDYYPYGGLFGESASRQSYKYSGKELETMNGLNTYDFHARPYYYPVLQFHSPDLLSENTPWLSPYLYCAGNPIMYIDPTGMECWWSQMWDDYNMPTRLYGAMKAAGGIAEATVGATAGVATSWTGVGAVLGGAALVHGCDVATSGISQMISGEETSSLTSQAMQATGVSPETAEMIDGGISIGLTGSAGMIKTGISATSKTAATSATAVSEAVMESHHIIPKQHMGHQLVKEAIKEGFKFNGPENIIRLEKFSKVTNIGQHGNHPTYNKYVRTLLDNYMEVSGTATERINGVIKELRTAIEANPNIKINDLYK